MEHIWCDFSPYYNVRDLLGRLSCGKQGTGDIIALDIFVNNRWRSNNRLCFLFIHLSLYTFHYFLSLWKLCCIRSQRLETTTFFKKKYLCVNHNLIFFFSWSIQLSHMPLRLPKSQRTKGPCLSLSLTSVSIPANIWWSGSIDQRDQSYVEAGVVGWPVGSV